MITIHTKDYLEEYARHMLKYLCDFNIGNLVHADMPDLQNQDDGLGIEVVEDTFQDEKELIRFWVENQNTPYDMIQQKKTEGYESRGGHLRVLDNRLIGGQIGSEKKNNPVHLIDTIRTKIDKLNSGNYINFPTYMLYVFTDTVSLHHSFVHTVILEINKIESPLRYETIFLDGRFEMCCCDMKQCKYERKSINQETRSRVVEETRSILENNV